MDRAEVVQAGRHVPSRSTCRHGLDRGRRRRRVDGPVDALFSCAGVADGTPGIEKINFLGHRLFIELLLEADMLPRGSAIGMISSAAGFGWEQNLEQAQRVPRHRRLRRGRPRGPLDNGKADYLWSKIAINAYVAREAIELLKKGIRINAILPGPTDTPLAQANADTWLTFGADYREEVGIEAVDPARAGLPARVPLQRRRRRHHRRSRS